MLRNLHSNRKSNTNRRYRKKILKKASRKSINRWHRAGSIYFNSKRSIKLRKWLKSNYDMKLVFNERVELRMAMYYYKDIV